jgi:steroid delta-isomerase-like uncharacterized protein
MSAEQNERLMRRYLDEVVDQRRIEVLDEIANADMVDEGMLALAGTHGREGLYAHIRVYYRAFADDTRVTVKRLIASDDEVMAWWTVDGVQVGDFGGVPATGERRTASACSFFKIRDGRIAHYSYLVVGDGFDPPTVFDSSTAALQTT